MLSDPYGVKKGRLKPEPTMIWDVHTHLSGVEGRTPEERMAKLIAFAERMGVERVCLSMGMTFLQDPAPKELRKQNDEALAAYAKQEEIGHRPTWKLGVNASAARMAQRGRADGGPDLQDAFNLFRGRAGREPERAEPRVGVLAKKALETLDLDDTADRVAIKARYKELVKRFHPDANGGDRSREGRLQEILKAYQTLKTNGLV